MDSIIFNEGALDISKATSHPLVNTLPYLEWELPESVVNSLIAFKAFFLKNQIKNLNYDVNFAKYLTEELSPQLDPILKFNAMSPFDWQTQNTEGYNVWGFEGVSPLFEFYQLRTYDAVRPQYETTQFVAEDPYIRTLMTGIIFLDDNTSAAHTLIDDGNSEVPFADRTVALEEIDEDPSSLISWALPKTGRLIVYPSQLCHSVLPVLTEQSSSFVKFHIFYNAMSKEAV